MRVVARQLEWLGQPGAAQGLHQHPWRHQHTAKPPPNSWLSKLTRQPPPPPPRAGERERERRGDRLLLRESRRGERLSRPREPAGQHGEATKRAGWQAVAWMVAQSARQWALVSARVCHHS